jgi:hypothetical protein
MKKYLKNNLLHLLSLISCLLGILSQAQAVVVGSKTTPSVQNYIEFPAIDTNNTALGFAAFNSGFGLQDVTTSCTYNNYLPVSGPITLNGGTLYLRQDLVLDSQSTFFSSGSVYGNTYAFELAKRSSDFDFPGLACVVRTGLTSFTIQDDATSLDWSINDDYVCFGTYNSSGPELYLGYFDGTVLTSTLSLNVGTNFQSVRWHPTERFLAASRFQTGGNEVITFQHKVFNGTLSVISGASVGGDVNAVCWHPSGNYLIAGTGLVGAAGRLIVYPSSSAVLSAGTVTNLAASSYVSRDALSFAPGGNMLAVGTVNNATTNISELLVYSFNGSLTLTTSLDVGNTVQAVDWCPTGTFIAAGLNGSTTNVRMYEMVSGTLREIIGARITESRVVWSLHWDRTGNYLAVGLDADPLLRQLDVYYFDKINKKLIRLLSDHTPEIGGEVMTVRWSRNNQNLAHGYETLGNLDVVAVSTIVNGFCPMVFNDITIVLNSDVNILAPINFRRTCKINGRGKRINLSSGSFIVRPGATLTIEDAEIQGMGSTNLRCMTNDGSIVLRNSIVTLAREYTFSQGSLLFSENVILTGTNKFNYTSKLSSTIASASTLFLDHDVTFSYAPLRAAQNLLYMADATSELYLNGCTLHSTRTGLYLSDGILTLDDKITMSSEAKFNAEALRLNSNLDIRVRGGAVLELFGRVIYG